MHVFLTADGYFKKITPLSLRMGGVHKYKPGDSLMWTGEASNADELLIFTDKAQVYPIRLSDFADMKASLLGEYLPARLGMEEGESIISAIMPGDYSGMLIIAFQNGQAIKLPMSVYVTKTNRRKLTGAYSSESPVASMLHLKADAPLVFTTSDSRAVLADSALIPQKQTRTSQGVSVVRLKARQSVAQMELLEGSSITNKSRYKVRSIPAAGAILKPEDKFERQLSLDSQDVQ